MKGSSLTELDEIRIDPARHHLKQEYLGLQRAVSVGRAGMTKGKFGFRGGGKHEPGPAAGYVQIYVKSSALSRSGGATQLAPPPRRAPLKQQSHF